MQRIPGTEFHATLEGSSIVYHNPKFRQKRMKIHAISLVEIQQMSKKKLGPSKSHSRYVHQERNLQPGKYKTIVPRRHLCYCCLFFRYKWRTISSLIFTLYFDSASFQENLSECM
jgi:hypothetical protein